MIENKILSDFTKFPQKIRKPIESGVSKGSNVKYDYELEKQYKNFGLYKNVKFPDIKETIDKYEIFKNSKISIVSDEEEFKNPYIEEIWEEEI